MVGEIIITIQVNVIKDSLLMIKSMVMDNIFSFLELLTKEIGAVE